MIDIHCHILPGVDDGPATVKEALQMAQMAAKDGVNTIVATPHCFDGLHEPDFEHVIALCDEFNQLLRLKNIKLQILPGAEFRLSPEVMDAVSKKNIVTLGSSIQHLLVELPVLFIPEAVVGMLNTIKQAGYTVIIAHPERNAMILNDHNLITDFIATGAELQITAGSLLGTYGRVSKDLSMLLLEMDVRCYLGSDGHDARRRKPLLSKAVKYAKKQIGKAGAAKLVEPDWINNSHPNRQHAIN